MKFSQKCRFLKLIVWYYPKLRLHSDRVDCVRGIKYLLSFKNLKNLGTRKNCCLYPKIWTMWFYHRVLLSEDADRIVNIVDLDQSTALRAGSTLFAQTNFGSLWYIHVHVQCSSYFWVEFQDLAFQDYFTRSELNQSSTVFKMWR